MQVAPVDIGPTKRHLQTDTHLLTTLLPQCYSARPNQTEGELVAQSGSTHSQKPEVECD